jgi:aminopeptidase C
MYGDCSYKFLGCVNFGDSLTKKTIDEFINELFKNKAYEKFMRNYSIVYCDAVKNGRITNYISFECENISKSEIKRIQKVNKGR